MMKARARLARTLTEAYTQQLLMLETPQVAEAKQGDLQRKVQKAKNKLLKASFISPAEQVATFVMLWIVDQLYEAPEIAQAVKVRGLDSVLFSCIVQRDPSPKLNTFWSHFAQKL